MGFKIEQLAQRAVESIKEEWEKHSDAKMQVIVTQFEDKF